MEDIGIGRCGNRWLRHRDFNHRFYIRYVIGPVIQFQCRYCTLQVGVHRIAWYNQIDEGQQYQMKRDLDRLFELHGVLGEDHGHP